MKEKLITLSNLSEFKTKMMVEVNAQGFVKKSVNDLLNYYLKSETYTKTEVDNIVSTIHQFTYEVAAELPTASANTMYIIYLVPSTQSGVSQNAKSEYITIRSGVEGSYTYSWEKIGDTEVDLSGYVTTTALNTILQDYVTSTDLATLLATKQDKIDSSHKLSADLVEDGETNKVFTATEKTKLSGIASGAQVNVIEAIEVNTGTTDSSNNAAVVDKTAKLVIASTQEIDDIFTSES